MLSWLVACSPEKTEGLPATQASSTVSNEAVVGAWTLADAFSPEVQEAARFAVQTFAVQNKARVLYKDVTQARQQVVAGLNFDLHIQVTLDGASRNASAKVWRQPDGAYHLQAWAWLD
ncbi:cystatin domain-containing protein [Limnohabitans sp.]|jgi:hypothetical protein|uniref:cystatin domain-containing protein n=1 Tax=Limnohabitans sp. TaxID=1907725 RepID=UPI0037C0FB3C